MDYLFYIIDLAQQKVWKTGDLNLAYRYSHSATHIVIDHKLGWWTTGSRPVTEIKETKNVEDLSPIT